MSDNLVRETMALLVSSTSREGVQAIRLPTLGKTIDIATQMDSTTGQEVVLWSDIALVFRNALYLQYGTKVIPFLKGADFKTLDPLRIAAVPGATLEVVVDEDDDDGSTSFGFSSSRIAVKKTKSKKLSAQKSRYHPSPIPQPTRHEPSSSWAPSIQSARSGAPQTAQTSFQEQSTGEPKSGSFFNSFFSNMRPEVPRERHQRDPFVTSNTAQRTPTNESVATAIDTPDKDLQPSSIDLSALRSPQYGLVEEALANYSHIEVPEGTFQLLLGTSKDGARNPQCDSSSDNTLTHTNDPQSLDSVKQPTRSPQYYSTLTTPTDTTQTIDSAKQGNTYAQVALGDMYREGNGVSKDLQAALDWFSKAAEQGDAVAQYKVGTLYNQGEGVSQDFSKAEEWYLRAAKQGYASAQRSLGSLYGSGQGGRVPEKDRNYRAAMEWYVKSANQRDAQAQYEIGRMFDHGIGVTQDDLKAKQWYLQAAESGHLGARERLQSPSGPVGRPQAEETTGCRIS